MNHTEEQRSRLITIIKVKELNPCDDRFNNFTKEYPNYSGTLREFLKLDKISYVDKVWVFTKLLDKDTLVRWSIKCAESVKYIYDNEMKDGKLDSVFNTLKSIKDFNNMSTREIEEVGLATRSAVWSAWSVWVAVWSEVWAARAARSAAWAAARSARSEVWAARAARSAAWAAVDEKQQEQLNLDLLVQVLDEKGL